MTAAAQERLQAALGQVNQAQAVLALAHVLKAESMGQVAMYRVFQQQLELLDGDDPGCDALADTMDLIWGGGWAKGRALFEQELSTERLARE
ncbi:hypothetical protein DZC30_16335 [Comamonas testosteroni]|uniref:Uncharacterized protein n=1 Tax=Comamonas testosteroni TaxID=285 RepID=A0A373FEX2_COMTE|nr:hypothetical protein [Comamonas testosteroni]RGE42681.1 hypothetical protein DZC30_16335 [Comamonas testosteroni]